MNNKPCKNCGGNGLIKYDHNHWRPCEKCCNHEAAGWWELTESYASHLAGADNGCCRSCGKLRRELDLENAQRRVIQKNTIADLLITHDIIQALSIEDAEGYDNFETSDNVMRFTLALESLLFPNVDVELPPPGCSASSKTNPGG